MKYDTYTSLTTAIADEFWCLSHGHPQTDLWLMEDGSVVRLNPSWPLPDDAVVLILSAAPLSDWLGPEYDGTEYTEAEALALAQDWMTNNGATAIADAEDMAAMMAEQEAIAAAAWKLYSEGEA